MRDLATRASLVIGRGVGRPFAGGKGGDGGTETATVFLGGATRTVANPDAPIVAPLTGGGGKESATADVERTNMEIAIVDRVTSIAPASFV